MLQQMMWLPLERMGIPKNQNFKESPNYLGRMEVVCCTIANSFRKNVANCHTICEETEQKSCRKVLKIFHALPLIVFLFVSHHFVYFREMDGILPLPFSGVCVFFCCRNGWASEQLYVCVRVCVLIVYGAVGKQSGAYQQRGGEPAMNNRTVRPATFASPFAANFWACLHDLNIRQAVSCRGRRAKVY